MAEQQIDFRPQIIEFINRNFLMNSHAVRYSNDDSFLEKGIIDSTGVLELVSFIQQEFGIQINDEDLIPENLDSVNNVAAFVKKRKERAVINM